MLLSSRNHAAIVVTGSLTYILISVLILQKDKDAERSFKWRNCALSQQPLQEPVVACGLGRLYSKSSVLEALLDKERKPESINHIKNLKVVGLKS